GMHARPINRALVMRYIYAEQVVGFSTLCDATQRQGRHQPHGCVEHTSCYGFFHSSFLSAWFLQSSFRLFGANPPRAFARAWRCRESVQSAGFSFQPGRLSSALRAGENRWLLEISRRMDRPSFRVDMFTSVFGIENPGDRGTLLADGAIPSGFRNGK